jgi:hypothetical protein
MRKAGLVAKRIQGAKGCARLRTATWTAAFPACSIPS